MLSLFFITGNHPRLSQAELVSVLKTNELAATGECILCNLTSRHNFEVTQNTLGGTVKAGTIIGQTTYDTFENEACSYIQKTLPQNQKIYFGISVYNTSCDIKKLGLRLKQKLAQKNIQSRWVESRDQALSAVVVKTNKLLSTRGVEFVIIQAGAKLFLGVTKTVQPFDEFSKRDYGRPHRDTASGMLPPKVAKIMINLARVKKNDALLDPFCGSGTILQEALLMGYTRVTGADISKKAITDTQANLHWLRSVYPRLPSPALYQVPSASL